MRLALGALGVLASAAFLAGCGHISVPGQPSPDLAPAAAAPLSSQASGPVVPAKVDVPSIKASSDLIRLGKDPKTGEAIVPDVHHPQQGGWLQVTYGKPPSDLDPYVILGHVDGDQQPGLFFHLRDVKEGDKVSLTMSDGVVRSYTVTHTQQIHKTKFPTAAVYGQTKGPEIRLITCGGAFNTKTRNYEDNIIVFAQQDADN